MEGVIEMEKLLEVCNVSKTFKDFKLQDVSFTLPKGFIMGYVGRNGAGKTTTINLISHICNPQTGTVKLDGITYEEDPIRYKEMIGFVGDESYFPKEFNLKDVKKVMKDCYRTFDEQRFNELVTHWNLPEKLKIEKYSRGMKVKLMFACTLSRETKLLILDEATNGLDPLMREEVLNLLQEYIADGEKSILFSTHMLNDLELIADYIVFIENGKIIINDTKDELLESYIQVKGSNDELSESIRKKAIGLTKKEFGFEALLETNDALGLSNKFVVEKPSIDQIMIYILRNKGVTSYESM